MALQIMLINMSWLKEHPVSFQVFLGPQVWALVHVTLRLWRAGEAVSVSEATGCVLFPL